MSDWQKRAAGDALRTLGTSSSPAPLGKRTPREDRAAKRAAVEGMRDHRRSTDLPDHIRALARAKTDAGRPLPDGIGTRSGSGASAPDHRSAKQRAVDAFRSCSPHNYLTAAEAGVGNDD